MKILIALSIIIALLSTNAVAADSCEYQKRFIDPVTQIKSFQTKWQIIAPKTYLSGTSSGDAKYLNVRWVITDYYPPQKGIRKKDPEYQTFIDHLVDDSFVFPAGSKLRVGFIDQSTFELILSESVSAPAQITEPNKRRKTENNAKGFGKFLANAVGADEVEDKNGPNFRADAKADLAFALDAEIVASLSEKEMHSMRMESQDRYFYAYFNPTATAKMREVLQCIE